MDVLATLIKLPKMCASILESTGQPIIIRRGVVGYYPVSPRLDVERFNQRHGVTKGQRTAMEVGSCFGWEIPAADPDSYPVG